MMLFLAAHAAFLFMQRKTKVYKKLAIVGGGQLGMMLARAAHTLGIEVAVLEEKAASAVQLGAIHVKGSINNPKDIRRLANLWGFEAPITIEVEHVAIDELSKLKNEGYTVDPDPETMGMIADKLLQKRFLKRHKLPVAPFKNIEKKQEVKDLLTKWKEGIVIKARTGGFDGRGNTIIKNKSNLFSKTLAQFFTSKNALYAEKIIPFFKELSVIAGRDRYGNTVFYPIVETTHVDGVCDMVTAPAEISKNEQKKAQDVARKTLEVLMGVGVFAIEMFLTKTGDILINEIAPRVHNSGHYTIESNTTSQFENHIRALTGRKLGAVNMKTPHAVMINILRGKGMHPLTVEKSGNAFVHWYGKEGKLPPLPPRKIGHVTGIGNTHEEALKSARKLHKKALQYKPV